MADPPVVSRAMNKHRAVIRRSKWNYSAVAGTEEDRMSMTAVLKQLLEIDFLSDILRKKKVHELFPPSTLIADALAVSRVVEVKSLPQP